MATLRWRVYGVVIAIGLTVLVAGCDGDDSSSSPPPGSTSARPSDDATVSTDSSTCGYLYEWATTFRFPLQPDPHAAYTYVLPRITSEPIGFEITGPFPHAAWTEWMVYTGFGEMAQPFSIVEGADVTPEPDSVNTFTPGTKVMAPDRRYRILIVPKGTDTAALPEDLGSTPSTNILTSPTKGHSFIIANRVYNAFPGYNQGGAAGPTDSPFPVVRSVDLTTGEGVDCSRLNLVPNAAAPTDMPTAQGTPGLAVALDGGARFGPGPGSIGTSGTGMEYAPALDPDRIEFTRPPLLPGADVSSVPPPDNCAGYLGAATSPTRIGIIRIPKVAHWFDTTDINAQSTFSQQQTSYISLTQYGAAVSTYESGSPISASLANEELLVDRSGGSTVVVWPRTLSAQQKRQVFDLAKQNGWALLRGGEQGKETTANLFLRMKGTSPSYQGGFTPTSERPGVPCYFDDHPQSSSWAKVAGDRYVASAASIGGAAPQGVNCPKVQAYLNGTCLTDLTTYIRSTGGAYSS